MIALTSLFNVKFPPLTKLIVQTLWALVALDFFEIEDRLGEILDFKETEAFLTVYDEDGEAESRFADADYESANFIANAGPLFVLLIFTLLIASLRSILALIVRNCKDNCCRKRFKKSVSFRIIWMRFLLEGCIEVGLSAMIAIKQVSSFFLLRFD